MIKNIEQWIDQTNADYASQRLSCGRFAEEFNGFYPESFLNNSFFVVVATIPKPGFPGLREMGLGDFMDMNANGITYKNTYYILAHLENNLRLHFHELVHVAQWGVLGSSNFIQRYIQEIQRYGYADAPLEDMAYKLDAHFTNKGEKFNIPAYVAKNI